MDDFCLKDGILHCEDVPLTALAEVVGTPTYVYSASGLELRAQDFRRAVASAGRSEPLVAFAIKANCNLGVIATLAAQGLAADIVSIGEYRRALIAGIPPDRIVFSGVGKTADELAEVFRGGLCQLNMESLEEAELASAIATSIGVDVPAAFRVNPDVDARTHAKIATGAAQSKFGIPIDQAVHAYARGLPHLRMQGIAVHIGSQIGELGPFETAWKKVGTLLRELRAAGHRIDHVDLGGGLGVSSDPDLSPPHLSDYGALAASISRLWDVRLIFEPGRAIAANAGVLLCRVVRVKPGLERPFVVLDAGMNDLARPALYDAFHAIEPVAPAGEIFTADIVGPVCENGDIFAKARSMGRVAAGDLVVFRSAGAYGATMAGSYCSRALVPEVMIRGGEWAWVRRRQTLDELIGADRVPPWLAPRPAGPGAPRDGNIFSLASR